MNDVQRCKKGELEQELYTRRGIPGPLPDKGESADGFWLTEVGGVTVIIGPRGGYQLPTVRTYYKKPLDAAVYADDEWKNRRRTHQQQVTLKRATSTPELIRTGVVRIRIVPAVRNPTLKD